ncbi:MAG: cell division protein ZapA [Tissierellia bacterium]|nr:cell division protein ZapA [Tissierellia bacterium]
MTEKNKINVLIDGRNFTVIGNGSENYVYKIASYVDEKIRETKDKNDKLSGSMAATLAALNIADELYRTSIELKSLKDQAKRPMEEYDALVEKLKEANVKIEELNTSCNSYKDELLDTKRENERLNKIINKHDQALELKEKELQENQNMIKKLQDKIFDNQIELIEIKKELEEALRLYDKEKNIFKREEV